MIMTEVAPQREFWKASLNLSVLHSRYWEQLLASLIPWRSQTLSGMGVSPAWPPPAVFILKLGDKALLQRKVP